MKNYDRPHFTYELYDADGRCLYVGATVNVASRLSDHRKNRPWGSDIARVEVKEYETRGQAFTAEYELIFDLAPLHNVRKRNLHPLIAAHREWVKHGQQ